MDFLEVRKFIELQQQQIKTSATIKTFLEKHPIFIFIDDKEDTFVANYLTEEKTVIYAKANPVKMLIFLISRKVGIDLFKDTLIVDLEKAIHEVLKTYNISLEETNGSNIQNKIPSDGSSEHQ
jgi:hypothetical protein